MLKRFIHLAPHLKQLPEGHNERALIAYVHDRQNNGTYPHVAAMNMKSAVHFLTKNGAWPDTDLITGMSERLDEGFGAALRNRKRPLADLTVQSYKAHLKRLIKDYRAGQPEPRASATHDSLAPSASMLQEPETNKLQANDATRFELSLGSSASVLITINRGISEPELRILRSQIGALLKRLGAERLP